MKEGLRIYLTTSFLKKMEENLQKEAQFLLLKEKLKIINKLLKQQLNS
jgi:hypothetical protein